MAKRQLSAIQIDGVEYNLSILTDLTILDQFVVYGEYETSLSEYSATKNTDFAPIKADATVTTNYDTNLIAKFERYVRNQEKAIMWYYNNSPIQYVAYNGSGTQAYYSIVLDDDVQQAWVVAIVYQNNTFEKNIIDYGGSGLYDAFYLPYVPPTPPGPQGDATCKVNYYLQDDEYIYSKIIFKEDTPPIDMNDGYVQDILASQSSVNIENLVEGQKYYFTIFTDKSESESFPYIVGEIPGPVIPPDLQPYVDLLASYGVGTNQTSSLTNCQDYEGNSNTVSMEGYSVCIDGNFNVNGNQYFMYIMSNCDIMVTNNNGSISVEYSFTMAPYDTIKTWGRSMWGPYEHSGNRIEYLALGIWTPAVPLDFYQPYNVDNVGITFTASFNSMVDCMNYLTQHFRRCNLYVDGKQWLKVN